MGFLEEKMPKKFKSRWEGKEQTKAEEYAEQIFINMEKRLAQLWDKLITRNFNNATQPAFELAFVSDIADALIKLKLVENDKS